MDRGKRYENLARQVSAIGAVKRGLARTLPAECPGGSAVVLALLHHHGDMRMGRVSELMAVDMSVSSRHVAHTVDRGWVERLPDPADKRSRILHLTPAGESMLAVLDRRLTDMLARTLAEWSDDDVELLTDLLARLRDSFGDCRAHHA
ncbi:winged helix-turn-helix transcriptional regulator [Streptomyces gardneri]|uniref:MarR family winged helix-turn-helix transcriptional regulator n=1 Tax=Streptomyces gardneri TaxID=66892 RepID=UPI0006E2EFE3|nr:MarR family winged helix-turn-helix transcriptional regulator [Streptomyces gardneri]QPK46851.1 winged helix-turn-helix transcriptional regulator [Streptomyces gardneri]WRK38255.1 MarR family winged helix-turn-helix transcriptional regulator [Streptomyces venezuelae]